MKTIIIVCTCTERAFHFLESSLSEGADFKLQWRKVAGDPIDPRHSSAFVEVASNPESLIALKEFVHLNPHAEVLSFSLDGSVLQAVESLKMGASNYFSLPEELDRLRRHLLATDRKETRRAGSRRFIEQRRSRYDFEQIIGKSPGLNKVLKIAERVIKTRASPLLIRGETGTGKELLARAIHYHSAEAEEPFVEVNCSAIPDKLLESELFGYEKGAFTDAKTTKKGLFEVAHNGTIFLDEIGQLNPNLQVKLLSVIEYKTIRRLGGTESIPIDIRIMAATNIDLENAIRENRFRKDMYYRLNLVSLTLPPLRERGNDIIVLAEHFLKRFVERYDLEKARKLSSGAEKALLAHSWPGNIRELMNTIERAVILFDGHTLDEDMLQIGDTALETGAEEGILSRLIIDIPEGGVSRERVEKIVLKETLRLTKGNRSKASRMLCVTRPTLISMIKRHNLK